MIHALHVSALADLIDAPDVQHQAVKDCRGGERCEEPRGGHRNGIAAKVEQRCGDRAQDDGEFEPGQERAFGGEVDFRFDTDWDVDP